MTEEEAIEALKLINLSRVHPFYTWEEMLEVRDMAIKALEEVQKYRAIGTVEELKTWCDLFGLDGFKKLEEYQKIGTVEELREAKEKQNPKKTTKSMDIYRNQYHTCPFCSRIVDDEVLVPEHCPNCGQKIDWEEEN